MAFKLGSLQVDIGADTKGLKSAEKDVKKLSGEMGKSFNRLGATIAAAFSIEAARRTLLLADQMRLLDVRMQNATKTQDEFNKSRQRLITLSNETGTILANNVKLFEALTLASDELGASNEHVLQLTESLNKLGVIGGSTAEQMGNSMLQLSQAMAGGIVRAEEFNSILENTPMIARAIAQGLNVSTGELRNMVLEGELLSNQVFNSILSQTDKINERFATIPLTIARASQAAVTNFGLVVNEINNGIGATETLAEKIQGFANILLELPNIVRVLFVGLISEIDQFFINASANINLFGLEIQKALTFSDEGEGIVQRKIDDIKRVRDIQIQASKDAVEAAIEDEIKLVLAKREISAGTGGGVKSPLEAVRLSAAMEVKVAEDKEKELLRIAKEGANARNQQKQIELATLAGFNDIATQLITSAGKEQSSIAKAAFLAGKAIQVATILAQTEVAAAAAGAVGAVGGVGGFFSSASAVRAAGFASAGLVAGLAVSDTFEHGGIVSGSSFTGDNVRVGVNSGEMILNRGQQSKLFAMANGDNSGGGSGNITINNNVGADVSASTMSDGQIMIEINKARKGAVNDVNQSLSTGRGGTSKALNQGFKTERNIR